MVFHTKPSLENETTEHTEHTEIRLSVRGIRDVRVPLISCAVVSHHFMNNFWTSPLMNGESVLVIAAEDERPAHAPLLFTPIEIRAVTNSAGDIGYQPGTDYIAEPETNALIVPRGSRIPVKTPAELTPPKGSQPYSLIRRDGAGDILFGASHEYHDMQVLVTYTHAAGEWAGPSPVFAGGQLPRTLSKLAQHQPVRVTLFGDSISTGCNASGWAGTPPFQPFYGELVRQRLEATYAAPVTLSNFSVGGMDSAWGVENMAPVLASNPDLLILAFGMNDSTGGRPTAAYIANTLRQIEIARASRPDTEFILVASMLPNADWHISKPELLLEYRDALGELVAPGVAMADVTSMWAEVSKRKRHLDITGNGVNHPNDFGHRLYADVLSALLIP